MPGSAWKDTESSFLFSGLVAASECVTFDGSGQIAWNHSTV